MAREVYQHPSQAGRPSFPSRAADGFRAYVKDSLLRYENEGEPEDETLEGEEPSEWEEMGGMHEEVPLLEEEEGEPAEELED